jgi:type II secretory pathway pseudopilin PulG
MLELTVVVAIVAILATIAMPAYQGYQARSRRAEGWNLLATYYTSAIAAKADYGDFPGNFVQTDFRPVGELGYRISAADGNDADIVINDDACIDTTAVCDCGGGCPDFKIWIDTGLGTQGNPVLGPQPPGGVCPSIAPLGVTVNTFSARASGQISAASAVPDTLGINELKIKEVCQRGY